MDGEGREARLARAAALRDAMMGTVLRDRAARDVRTAARVAREGPTLGGLSDGARSVLSGLALHERRYGLTHAARRILRQMGCRSLLDVADAPAGRCEGWLGYAEADGVAARLADVAAEADAGAAEPGIARMGAGLSADDLEWADGRHVEDVAGRGIPRKVALALREAGYDTLGALAREDADTIEDVAGIGAATVVALRGRLAALAADAASSPALRRRRLAEFEDAAWDEAAPVRAAPGK